MGHRMSTLREQHAAHANWMRSLILAVLHREGIDSREYDARYTWDGQWFPFMFGLGGERTGCPCGTCRAASQPDPEREAANSEGFAVRERCSPEAQQALSDLASICPSYPGDLTEGDLCELYESWGIVTEIAADLGVPVPPEVELLHHEAGRPE